MGSALFDAQGIYSYAARWAADGVDRTEGWRRMTSRIKGLELPKLPFMICGVLTRGEWVFPRFFLDVGLHPSVGQIIGL